MKTPLRISPIHSQLQTINATWQTINQMPSVVTTSDDTEKITQLGIADLSFLTRCGIKGANVAAWLENQGIPVPTHPNTWCSLSSSGLVARLGLNEFLIEDGLDSAIAPRLAEQCQHPPAKVYPVLRQDLAIALLGPTVHDLLLQTCNINFQALNLSENPVVLTSMMGVTMIVIPGARSGLPFYRLWCDGTFGNYVWRTLLEIAEELGGGVVGAKQVV
ncbi:MAG: methylglutamate dehydrogenase [Leptolyngbyaceae cyanobacterium RU_5_1]|nr:methylglutamate dehydrogenase [Leptolyngbyaceae cyanobacterium RU_5_1]